MEAFYVFTILFWVIGFIAATFLRRNERGTLSKFNYILSCFIPWYFVIWAIFFNVSKALED